MAMKNKNDIALGLLAVSLACLAGAACAQQASSPAMASVQEGIDVGYVALADLEEAPSVTISNGRLSARIYLPDAEHGFYRGTRFDWAGVIGSLRFGGHDFYVPWFDAVSAGVRDFAFANDAVVVSPNTGATGPVEEFNSEGGALGYAEAAPGGNFLKIGVGVLRRTDDSNYDRFRLYTLVDGGERVNEVSGSRAAFVHRVGDAGSGYGYDYTKTLRLEENQPVLVIDHVLKNTGSRQIETTVYNHNFLNIDGAGTGRGLELSVPFVLAAETPPDPALAEIRDNRFVYLGTPGTDERVSARLAGYGGSADDYDFHIVNRGTGAGVRIRGDRPVNRLVLWSIRPVMSIEPFIAMSIGPGESFSWSYRYEFEAGAAGIGR